jgi:hypothetical protein
MGTIAMPIGIPMGMPGIAFIGIGFVGICIAAFMIGSLRVRGSDRRRSGLFSGDASTF